MPIPGETAAADNAVGVDQILFIDNFDSFTYNLVEYAGEVVSSDRQLGESDSRTTPGETEAVVLRNTVSIDTVLAVDPDAIILSPGPGHPKNERDVGITSAVLTQLTPEIPTFGVCLGLEAAVYEYGGVVGHAPKPVHGKTVTISHDENGIFAGIEQDFPAGRYHSLVATEVPDVLTVSATAIADDGTELVMGVRHREYPLSAVQFHPESVLTPVGHDLIRNFVNGS